MEEQEPPMEEVHEQIHHRAEHGGERWVMGVALCTALLAALAAIASLLSGDNVNEAMYDQMLASDNWNYYQAEGIKKNLLETRLELSEVDAQTADKLRSKIADYEKTREKLRADASERERSAKERMERHHKLAKSVTWSQIAIAISAISVLTRQKWFWWIGLAFGIAGLSFLLWGVIT